MPKSLGVMFVAAALLIGACGGKGNTPTAPTAPSGGSVALPSPAGAPTPTAGAGEADLKGAIEALPPTTPALSFKVAGKTVTTTPATVFLDGSVAKTFADLRLNTLVEVKGSLSGDTVAAMRVEIEEAGAPAPTAPNPAPPAPGPNPGPNPEAEFSGPISGLTGGASAFQFNIAGRLVKADGATAILGDSNTTKAFADLKTGTEVEVKGVQLSGFVQASRIKLEDEDEEEDVKVEGTLGVVSGTCPAITSTVNSTKFVTSASTRFDDACGGFRSGDKVEVRGARNTNGSIAATRLRKR